jgi:hypothetical protein
MKKTKAPAQCILPLQLRRVGLALAADFTYVKSAIDAPNHICKIFARRNRPQVMTGNSRPLLISAMAPVIVSK